MNKGYAFGFLIVLLVVILGLYVAFTSFMSSREAARVQSSAASSTDVARTDSTPTAPPPSPTSGSMVIPTPLPGITATLTALMTVEVTEAPPPTQPPPPSPTTAPPVRPSNTPVLPVRPPTPIPAPALPFRLAGPPGYDPTYQSCCYIFGTVRSAAGSGLEGVRVQALNEWNTLPPALTKGGVEMGQYNIPIGYDAVNWYVVVVDAGGNQISSQVPIQFDPSVGNSYRVDWQRTY